jgi:phosphoserine phosphatase RsbU/P
MSLKNESKEALESTKSFYREYTDDMTRERFSREFHADTDRLKELYKEAIGSDVDEVTGEPIALHVKMGRLFKSLSMRLNPTRRIVFAVSLVGFAIQFLYTGFIGTALLTVSFAAMAMILLLELLEKLDVKQEMDLAKELQVSLLPPSKARIGGLEIHSFANTARDVGGDYVDLIETDEGLYYIIADVSGKGLSAALYMIRMQALVHLLIKKDKPTPKQLFIELNNYIKSYRSDKTFITACAAFFPKNEDYFVYTRAGHNPAIIYTREKDSTVELQTTGFALGMTKSSRLSSFMKETRIAFREGDTVLFYTDGLTEARNEDGEEYGSSRIRSLMDIYGSLEAKSIVHKIQTSLEAFIGNAKTVDDITFSCIRKERSGVIAGTIGKARKSQKTSSHNDTDQDNGQDDQNNKGSKAEKVTKE